MSFDIPFLYTQARARLDDAERVYGNKDLYMTLVETGWAIKYLTVISKQVSEQLSSIDKTEKTK